MGVPPTPEIKEEESEETNMAFNQKSADVGVSVDMHMKEKSDDLMKTVNND